MEPQGRESRRQYSFQRNAVVLASFTHKYVAYLLPALLRVGAVATCREREDEAMENMVRFVVDMALAVSANGFAWSRALKRKLERGANVKKLSNVNESFLISSADIPSSCGEMNGLNVVMMFNELRILSAIARPLAPIGSRASAKPKKVGALKVARPRRCSSVRALSGEDEDVRHCVRTLRRILPGGKRMGVCELICEVESYVTCLELQVGILRSLVGSR